MCMRERRIYIKDRDNVWFKKQEYDMNMIYIKKTRFYQLYNDK